MAQLGIWTRFEYPLNCPVHLSHEAAGECIYARERLSRGGYDASEANNLISNFKIRPSVRVEKPYRWRHKERAVARFAAEITPLLPQGGFVAAIPQSKARNHPDYDPRYDMLFAEFRRTRPDITACEPLVRTESVVAAHEADVRPDRDEILRTVRYAGFGQQTSPPFLIFLDDVITTGLHYMVCRELVLANAPSIRVFGAFWAKTIWQD